MKNKKKKTRRSEAKYPALNPHLNLKTRFEQLDYDYVDTLSEKDKQWLNDFSSEYIHAEFNETKRVMKKKRVPGERNQDLNKLKENIIDIVKQINSLIKDSNISSASKVRLRKIVEKMKKDFKEQIKKDLTFIDDIYRKEAYGRNNSRNRCILTRARAQGKAIGIDEIPLTKLSSDNVEDTLIELIDNKRNSEEI